MKGVFFDMMKGAKRSVMSAKFHNTMARALLEMSLKLRKKTGITKVALTGGVFGNRFLTSRAAGLLKSAGFGVFVHKNFSCGDDGIPVGQLAAANAACI
jgi:hydrogenase maturation protein HypF